MRLTVRQLQAFPAFCGGRPVPVGRAHSTTQQVDTTQVAAVGRFGVHGDAVARLLVRLHTGEEFQVMHQDQADPAAALWLRRITRKWTDMPHTDRHVGWAVIWHVVEA